MAFISNFTCRKCGDQKSEMVGYNDHSSICALCRRNEADEKKRTHLKGLEALTIEERLRRIEEWIYDYKPVYVPPPRF